MVRCPKCKSDNYTISYIDDHDRDDNEVYLFSKVKCSDCGSKFFIKETFKFVNDENWGDYLEE